MLYKISKWEDLLMFHAWGIDGYRAMVVNFQYYYTMIINFSGGHKASAEVTRCLSPYIR